MATIPLIPVPVDVGSPTFAAICHWPFADEFVTGLLVDDVPQRIDFQNGQLWAYLDPDRTIVAFGTLDVCDEYAPLTDGRPHAYLPLLAVHPEHQGRGHGRSVMAHLTEAATAVVRANPRSLHPSLFLDVYERSVAAFHLYQSCGFEVLATGTLTDPLSGQPYRVMSRRVAP